MTEAVIGFIIGCIATNLLWISKIGDVNDK